MRNMLKMLKKINFWIKKQNIRYYKESVRYEYNSEIMKHVKLIKILSDKIKSPIKLSVVTTN